MRMPRTHHANRGKTEKERRAEETDARVRRAAHRQHHMYWQLERRPHITYKRITHKHTRAQFHVSYHAAGRDDEG